MTDSNLPGPEVPEVPETGDLELIVSYLNKQLDPDRVAQVQRRLEDDPEFRELAAPMLLVWSIPRHIERHPRPPGELERHWDEFTKRAGFAHQKRKARRRRLWIFAIAVLAVGLASFAFRGRLAATYADLRYYDAVPADTGWIRLRDGSLVRLSAGARLRSSRRLEDEVQHVKLLAGEARFRVIPRDSGDLPMGIQPFSVDTRAGNAFTARGEFSVQVRGDTTVVDVHHPTDRRFIGFFPLPTSVLVATHAEPTPVNIKEGSRALLVTGQPVQRLSPEPK